MKLAAWARDPQIVLTVLCGLFFVIGLLTDQHWISGISIACGSWFAVKSMIVSIRERVLDVNVLMLMAAMGAVAVGRPEDAAALLFLFSLSTTMEALAMAKTKSAIESLVKLRPDKAIRIVDGKDESVPVESLKIGDRVRVLAFQNIPADGHLTDDSATIDESAMTGESKPAQKVSGDLLMTGTQNLDQMIVLTVTTESGNSALDKVVNLVSEAQTNKASGERISVWFGQKYTLVVVAAFVISLVIRLALGAPFQPSLYASLTLLVALSPCALVISTPASTLSALANAARQGVLIRGGEFIELVGQIDTVAMDKTGTLTLGKPTLSRIHHFKHDAETNEEEWSAGKPLAPHVQEALAMAASLEKFSTHPIAKAIEDASAQNGCATFEVTDHQSIPGMGIEATINGVPVKIGQLRFFRGEGKSIPDPVAQLAESWGSLGFTTVLMNFGTKWSLFGTEDLARPEAKGLLKKLHLAGVKTIAMLTGDNAGTAKTIGTDLGIDEIHAQLLPQDKAKIIEQYTSGGHKVMMIGDGINDAPALTLATVGVAMGGLGSDVALESADIVLVQDRLDKVPALIRLGKLTNRVIRANLLFASGVICTLTLLSFLWPNIEFLRHLSVGLPLPIAVIGHEGSTVVVILNGLRLLKGANEPELVT